MPAVKLSEEIVEAARDEGALMHRSISGQVEYWAKLGRSIEICGFTHAQVKNLLNGIGSIQDLTAETRGHYVNAMDDMVESHDGSDTRVIRELEERGLPITGEDDRHKLVVRK